MDIVKKPIERLAFYVNLTVFIYCDIIEVCERGLKMKTSIQPQTFYYRFKTNYVWLVLTLLLSL